MQKCYIISFGERSECIQFVWRDAVALSFFKQTLTAHAQQRERRANYHAWTWMADYSIMSRYKTHQRTHKTHIAAACQHTFTPSITNWWLSSTWADCFLWRGKETKQGKEESCCCFRKNKNKLMLLHLTFVALSLSQEGWTPTPKPRLRSSSFQTTWVNH